MILDLTLATDHENGGFPFVARMEQSVIRVSACTHSSRSATSHVDLDQDHRLRDHPGTPLKTHPRASYFSKEAR